MSLIENAKLLVTNKTVQEASGDVISDSVDALLGNPTSYAKLLLTLSKAPFFMKEQLFWSKFEHFLNGAFLSEDDSAKFRAFLVENGCESENARRLIAYIDHSETLTKVEYLINATRCLLSEFISISDYYRICHCIKNSLEEDLVFLREHVLENNNGDIDYPYNDCVQGLLTSGLMYQSTIDAGEGDNRYSFVPFADKVDRYAVSYHDDARYPNPLETNAPRAIHQKVELDYKFEEISVDDVNAAFDASS